jgi:hypothetical protein
MSNAKPSKYDSKRPIVFSIYFLIVGLMMIIIVQVTNKAEFFHGTDIAHWFGLVIDMGIAIGIAIVVWHYTKNEQSKTNSLILKVNEIAIKLEQIIQNQEDSKQKRRKTALGRFNTLLTQLWSETQYHEALLTIYYGGEISENWKDYKFTENETTKEWIEMIKKQGIQIGEEVRNWTLTSYDLLDPELLYALQCIYLYAAKPFTFDKEQPQWDLMDCQDQNDWLESVLVEHFHHSKDDIGTCKPGDIK